MDVTVLIHRFNTDIKMSRQMSKNQHYTRRYPKLVEHVFDEAVPYVWWSRGNYGLAEAAFLHIAEKRKGRIFIACN